MSALENANIACLFSAAVQRHPERTALVQGSAAVSFGALQAAVAQTAASYQARGIGAGSKVLVAVPMSLDLYRIVLALLHLGASPVFLDEWVSLSRLKACLQTVPPDAWVAGRKLRWLGYFIPALWRIPQRLSAAPPSAARAVPAIAPVAPDATALVTFTTGSTGTPKAANRTHAFLHAQFQALLPHLEGVEPPVLTLLPVVALLHLGLGKTTVLPPKGFSTRRPDGGGALAGVATATLIPSLVGSPAPLLELARRARAQDLPFRAGVRHLLTGGGPIWPDEAAELLRAFPQADVHAVYGSTESEPIATLSAAELAATPDAVLLERGLPVGRPDAAVRVAIIPVQDAPVPPPDAVEWQGLQVPPGIPGELVVAGAHVLREYLANPGAVARYKIDAGGTIWHRTGDLVRQAPDGQLYLLGRCGDEILQNGRTIYPMIAARLFSRRSGAADAALLPLDGQLYLVLVKGPHYSDAQAEHALQQLGLTGISMLTLPELPKDPRHRTKTDTARLAAAVRRRRP